MRYYIYDGTLQGFYSAVFAAYADPFSHLTSDTVQLSFDDSTMPVNTDKNNSMRVLQKIRQYDRDAENEIYAVLKSNLSDRAQRAYRYICAILRHRSPVRNRLADTDVLNALKAVQKVWTEVHRMKGFLRFTETESGILYAPYAPDNDITEYLIPHFIERFASVNFIIHDTKRKLAGLYNRKSALLAPLENCDIALSDKEELFCNLWREYYAAVNIPERKRLKQMRGYMPVRYWKFLPEKRP